MQNKVPKVDVETLEPATWPANPAKEWCPPGHGDLYAALSGSGKLDQVCVCVCVLACTYVCVRMRVCESVCVRLFRMRLLCFCFFL